MAAAAAIPAAIRRLVVRITAIARESSSVGGALWCVRALLVVGLARFAGSAWSRFRLVEDSPGRVRAARADINTTRTRSGASCAVAGGRIPAIIRTHRVASGGAGWDGHHTSPVAARGR
ncbi:hypothetical protein GCM10022420_039560 [Streptomyces iranensis]